jgi:DNA-binding XRE family transcriptional regulator
MGIKHLEEILGRRIAFMALFLALLQTHRDPREKTPMNRIRAARQALGWTQNDLAKKANVSPRTIHAVEKGRPCRQATKRHILNALGVPWEMRDEYFVRARSVRPMIATLDEAKSA